MTNKITIDFSISIVSPVYNAEQTIIELIERIEETLSPHNINYEIILVEDGSVDSSWQKIKEICSINTKVVGIKLSRNFGQHYALTAGLERTTGDWVIVMDCDLQDRPEEIPKLIKKVSEGFDIVLAKRKNRSDSFFKKLSSKLFYSIFAYFTNTDQDADISSFGIYRKNTIEAILRMGDSVRVFPILVQWIGFNKTKIEVNHDFRKNGKSNYSFIKLSKLAFNMIISFSDKPLKLVTIFGAIVVLTSVFLGGFNYYQYIIGRIEVPGYASLIISIWFLNGVIILFIGLIGLYLSKVFDKVKNRPFFIVDEILN